LGGVILDFDRLPAIHQRVDDILSEIFDSHRQALFPEIHARPIVSGKKALLGSIWKTLCVSVRRAVDHRYGLL